MALTSAESRLLKRLATLHEEKDRAALAALRRGLGKPPGRAPEMWPVLLPYLPETIPRRVLDRCLVIAALFASHPEPWDGPEEPWARNLGASLRRFDEAQLRGDPLDKAPSPGIQRRLVALLKSEEAELPDRLRHAVALLKSGDVPVHWGQLLTDLGRWTVPDRPVQRAWARSFWGGRGLDAPTVTEDPDADDEG
ncbi:MAG: type I-E CRISPR-associated protein Cse2/CasB [Chloroflexia bacterium]|nr:type I-E CRISPR-associated protein Cse2/CasB [Chloroflexia bacterium]